MCDVMYEPSAIWSASPVIFDRDISNTQNVILSQGSSALRTTVQKIDDLHSLVPPDAENAVFFDVRIPPILQDLCYHAGLASTILFNNNKKQGFKETGNAYILRLERVEYVNNFCEEQSITTTTLTNRDIRNSLTHIDEKLGYFLTLEENVGWFVDFAATHRNKFLVPEGLTAKYCRSYVSSEDRILHLDQELHLGQLRKECVTVLAVVFGVDLVGPTLQTI